MLQMQQAELEEVRQREANLTALAAIGPRRKKPKIEGPDTVSRLKIKLQLWIVVSEKHPRYY